MTDETNAPSPEPTEQQATEPQGKEEVTLEQAHQSAQEALERATKEAKEKEPEPVEEDEDDKPISPTAIPDELKTGDAYIDAGLRLIVKSGDVSVNDIREMMGEFFVSGNPKDINGTYIKEKFGESADFALNLVKEYTSRIETETTKMVTEVHKMAGGSGAWDVAMTAFNTGAPDYLQDAARVLVSKGDTVGAAKVVLDYVSRTGRGSNKGKLVKGGTANLNAPLSKEEFNEAYADLKKRYPNQSLSSGQAGREMQRLIDRRALAKKVNR